MGKEISKIENTFEGKLESVFELVEKFEKRLELLTPKFSDGSKEFIQSIRKLLQNFDQWFPTASISTVFELANDFGVINNKRPHSRIKKWGYMEWKKFSYKEEDLSSTDGEESDGESKQKSSFIIFHQVAKHFNEKQFLIFKDFIVYFFSATLDLRIYLDNKEKPNSLILKKKEEETEGEGEGEQDMVLKEIATKDVEILPSDEPKDYDSEEEEEEEDDEDEWMKEIASRYLRDSEIFEKKSDDLVTERANSPVGSFSPLKEKKVKSYLRKARVKLKKGRELLSTYQEKQNFKKKIIQRCREAIPLSPTDIVLLLSELLEFIESEEVLKFAEILDPIVSKMLKELNKKISDGFKCFEEVLGKYIIPVMKIFMDVSEDIILQKLSSFGKLFLLKFMKVTSYFVNCISGVVDSSGMVLADTGKVKELTFRARLRNLSLLVPKFIEEGELDINIFSKHEVDYVVGCIEKQDLSILEFMRVFGITFIDGYWFGALFYEIIKKSNLMKVIDDCVEFVCSKFNIELKNMIAFSEKVVEEKDTTIQQGNEETRINEEEVGVSKTKSIKLPKKVVKNLDEIKKNVEMFIKEFGGIHEGYIGSYLRHQRLIRNISSSVLLFSGAYFLGRSAKKRIILGIGLILSSLIVFWVNTN